MCHENVASLPIEPETGRLVCRHRLAICGLCRVNFKFHNAKAEELNAGNEEQERESSRTAPSTGKVFCRYRRARCGECRVNYKFQNAEIDKLDAENAKSSEVIVIGNDEGHEESADSVPPIERTIGKGVDRHRPAFSEMRRISFKFRNGKLDDLKPKDKENESEPIIASDDEDNGESNHSEPCWAKRFSPPTPSDSPRNLFAEGRTPLMPYRTRYTRIGNPQGLLLHIDGACVEKGREAPRGGCSVVFHPDYPDQVSSLPFRLDSSNPSGTTETVHTDDRRGKLYIGDRARLRAVVAAFQHQPWYVEDFKRVVIATDCAHLISGVTEWSKGWIRNGWRSHQGTKIKSQDIWMLLLLEVQKSDRNALDWFRTCGECDAEDVEVLCWMLAREVNQRADKLAERPATKEVDPAFLPSKALVLGAANP